MNAPTAPASYLLEAAGISKSFKKSGGDVRVLSGAGLTLSPGETVSLTGASGCGKSTFLHIIGLLETPDAGEVIICGERLAHAGEAKRSSARRRFLGFVYQFHGLLGDFTALENVALPFAISGKVTPEFKERAEYLLQLMDVYHRRNHTATELSGGEQQRVAVARALARFPSVLLADEPTGNLDEETAGRVMEALMTYCAERSAGLVCVTHHPALAGMCSSKYVLRGGSAHRKT